ncbi:MAG: L,D-transpeptidase [Bacteroidetes bacterium]|nr:L,D-transpeptidase [Bacteroidota bacterium]
MKYIIILLFCLASNFSSVAQGYVNQEAIAPLVASQCGDIDSIQRTAWHPYTYTTLSQLEQHIDSIPGFYHDERRYIVELANRITYDNMKAGRVLFIPDSFRYDYRSYAPYPFIYLAALQLPKLFIIDKFTQTFGAYEYGKLVHWGLVSSGRKNNLTPPGRYNFNWRAYYKKSTAAPPGEVWEMYWVYDFYAGPGIHVHQYSLPIGIAASHGCVRTSLYDAIWNYNWANGWVHNAKGSVIRNGTPVMVINNNPPGRPAQWKLVNNEVVSQVILPVSLYDVRPGSVLQKKLSWESNW